MLITGLMHLQGVFQQVIATKEPREALHEAIHLLRKTDNPQVEYIVRVMQRWDEQSFP